jgi:hypothetical protein
MPSSTKWSPNDLRSPATLIANWDELAGMPSPIRRLRAGSGPGGCRAGTSSFWATTTSLPLIPFFMALAV